MVQKCEDCGREFKNGQGLAGHRAWAHPKSRLSEHRSPEEALIECLGPLQETLDRVGEQVTVLAHQFEAVDSKLDGFQASLVDRVSDAEAAKKRAEDETEDLHRDLDDWQNAKMHHRLLSLWRNAENCSDCLADKETIVAEIRGVALEPSPETLEPSAEVAATGAEPETQGETPEPSPETLEPSAEVAATGAEPETHVAERIRYRIVKTPSIGLLLSSEIQAKMKTLPVDFRDPRIGEETEDPDVAQALRDIGCQIEELAAVPAPTPNPDNQEEKPEVKEPEKEPEKYPDVVSFLTRDDKKKGK